MIVQALKKEDVKEVARIANLCFRGYGSFQGARKWITCNFNAFPRARYFVAKQEGRVIGYILWLEKGGFRKEAVWELEQIAVGSEFQGKGVATEMILGSLEKIKKELKKRGSSLKAVEVTTGTDNKARGLYQKTLNAKKEAVIKDLFRGDEVIMIARNLA